jgi:hypothetical protein
MPWMLPLFELHQQLSKEYDLADTRTEYSWPEEQRKEYWEEKKQWLRDIIKEDDGIIELETGEELDVVRRLHKNSPDMYLTVEYKGGIVYALKDQ